MNIDAVHGEIGELRIGALEAYHPRHRIILPSPPAAINTTDAGSPLAMQLAKPASLDCTSAPGAVTPGEFPCNPLLSTT